MIHWIRTASRVVSAKPTYCLAERGLRCSAGVTQTPNIWRRDLSGFV